MSALVLPEITGHTRLFAILADPIHHVRTPQVINADFARRGFDGVMVPMQVKASNLASAVAALRRIENFGGFIVTVPHKVEIVSLLDAVTPDARSIGAVNCVRREADGKLVGTMLDGKGFVAGLRTEGIEPKGKSAFLAGAGGAANAIAFALAEAGISRLAISNRTGAKSEDLKERLAMRHPALEIDIAPSSPMGYQLVVNATSLGMKDSDPLPLDASALSPDQCVAEIIMQPEVTALLAAAKARGCRTQAGAFMLREQVDLMVRHLLGIGA